MGRSDVYGEWKDRFLTIQSMCHVLKQAQMPQKEEQRQYLGQLLQILQATKHLFMQLFCTLSVSSEDIEKKFKKLESEGQQLLKHLEQHYNLPNPSIQALRLLKLQCRDRDLKLILDQVIPRTHTLMSWGRLPALSSQAVPPGHTAYSWGLLQPGLTRRDTLHKIYKFLDEYQQKYFFQAGLAHEQITMKQKSPYTLENFAYGTTSFHTWHKVIHQSHALQQAALNCREKQLEIVVFGSSVGWLVFYAALTLQLPCHGYELLSFLVQVAQKTRHKFKVDDLTTFTCANMLKAALQNTGILILTSLCWDSTLTDQVYHKLDQELPGDAVVIDYRDELDKYARFRRTDTLEGIASWNPSQHLYIYQVSL